MPYIVFMTIKRLQEIIDENADAAESGDVTAQGLVVRAMAELEDVIARNKAQEAERDEWCEGAGVPVDPFTEALEAKREADERAEFGGFTREELTDFSMLTDEEMEGDW